jgi:hypothetical protein
MKRDQMDLYITPAQKNLHIIPVAEDAALMIFEAHLADCSQIPMIARIYRADCAFCPMDQGRVLTARAKRNCGLVIRTRPGDILAIVEPRPRKQGLNWLFLSVGEDFVLTVIENRRKLDYKEIQQLQSDSKIPLTKSLKVTDEDLRRLFQASCPPWLDSILQSQLHDWKARDPAAFAYYTPTVPAPGDLDRCITAAPLVMLERWRDHLSEQQLAKCIGLSSEGAVRYAFDKIPVRLREEYLRRHAAIALHYWRHILADRDWAACAEAQPRETYNLRMSIPSRDRAYILATVYDILWILPFTNPNHAEQKEIIESILKHPDVWLSIHQSCFRTMFCKLERLTMIRLGLTEIDALRHHRNEEVRNRIHEYIANQI